MLTVLITVGIITAAIGTMAVVCCVMGGRSEQEACSGAAHGVAKASEVGLVA